jgi:catechol 2,3-dioxygenase-like lactoylglutathione lyase family enzyme
MVSILRTHIRVLCPDFAACCRFYGQVLQLPLRHLDKGQKYAEFKSDTLHIALFDRKAMAMVLGSRCRTEDAKGVPDKEVIVLRVENVDKAYVEMRQNGARFFTYPQDRLEWGCRTAHFRDPAGTVFELNADL